MNDQDPKGFKTIVFTCVFGIVFGLGINFVSNPDFFVDLINSFKHKQPDDNLRNQTHIKNYAVIWSMLFPPIITTACGLLFNEEKKKRQKTSTIKKLKYEEEHFLTLRKFINKTISSGGITKPIIITTSSLNFLNEMNKVQCNYFKKLCQLLPHHNGHKIIINMYFENDSDYEKDMENRFHLMLQSIGEKASKEKIEFFKLKHKPNNDSILIEALTCEAHKNKDKESAYAFCHIYDADLTDARRNSPSNSSEARVQISEKIKSEAWDHAFSRAKFSIKKRKSIFNFII